VPLCPHRLFVLQFAKLLVRPLDPPSPLLGRLPGTSVAPALRLPRIVVERAFSSLTRSATAAAMLSSRWPVLSEPRPARARTLVPSIASSSKVY
jgi:hypothetical protein